MLDDQLFISGAWVSSAVRFTNTSGTPLASVADGATGEALADVYTLAISSVGGGTCTVTVTTASPNNPYGNPPRVVSGVAIDGVTQYRNIVPGVLLVFSNTAANGNTAQVSAGLYLGPFDAFGSGAGVPSAETRHRVVNNGTGPVSNAQAALKTHAVLVKKVGLALISVKPFADGAAEKEAGGGSTQTMPYALTLSGTAGSGGAKTTNLSVDGVLVPAGQLADLNASGAAVSGTGVKAVAGQSYRFLAPHVLQGLEFSIDPACADGDTANVLIFPARHVQIAREVGGAADAADWGTDPVTLTQAGQSAGVIQMAGEAFYWTRVVVPPGASAQKNPEPMDVSLSATETGSAGWFA